MPDTLQATTLGLGGPFALYTRQPFREWREPTRSRPAGMPYPAWIDPSGFWAEGPRHWLGKAKLEVCDRYYASTHGSCLHLTLAANCWLDPSARKIGLGPVLDYALRPYRWQSPGVQTAYETVSLGRVTAGQVASVADVGRTDGDGNELHEPTPAEADLVAEIHSWDEDAATLLAFGPEAGGKRPVLWPVGEPGMAPPADFPFYGRPDPHVYFAGTQHAPYEDNPVGTPGRSAKSGQGFIAWTPSVEGQMLGADWAAVAAAIAEGPLDEIGQGGTYSQEYPLPRPDPFVAFDIRILKTVTLVSGHHRAEHGKEQRKDYDFELWQITGTAAKKGGGIQHSY